MDSIGNGIAGVILAGVAGSVAAGVTINEQGPTRIGKDSWVQTGEVGSNPVVRTTREEFPFGATGRIEIRNIDGNVDISSGKGDAVAFAYERKAKTERDFACQTFRFEHDKDTLRIWVDRSKDKECRVIYATDALTITVPRGADVSIDSVGDSLRATGLDGLLRISSVGDSATLTDVQQVVAESIGDTLKLAVSHLGPKGIEIDSVGDTVELSLPEQIDARLRISSTGGRIRGPGLHRKGYDGFETVLGKGGPMIDIGSVGDDVVIHGPEMRVREE